LKASPLHPELPPPEQESPPLLPEQESLLLLPEHELPSLLEPEQVSLLLVPSVLLDPEQESLLLLLLPDESVDPSHPPLELPWVPEQSQVVSLEAAAPRTLAVMSSPSPKPTSAPPGDIPLLVPLVEPELELEVLPGCTPASPQSLVSTLAASSTGLAGLPAPKPRIESSPYEPPGMTRLCRVTQAKEGTRPERARARSSAPGPQRSLLGSISPAPGDSVQVDAGATTPRAARGQTAATGPLLTSSSGVAEAMHDAASKAPSP
jgi:hypothetical protein